MRYTKDRCLNCGAPHRKAYPVSDFWFCSEQHYLDECYKLVPDEFGPDRTYFDDPDVSHTFQLYRDHSNYDDMSDQELVRRIGQDRPQFRYLIDQWQARCSAARTEANNQLYGRIKAEAEHQRDEQAEKDRIAREKLEEKEQIAREKQEAKEEQERLTREVEEEEEERWRPKRFDV